MSARMSDEVFERRFCSWEEDAPTLLSEARRARESEAAALTLLAKCWEQTHWLEERSSLGRAMLDLLKKAGRR